MTSESESKVRVFTPFPKLPEVNLTDAKQLLLAARHRVVGIGGMYEQMSCEFQNINKTYGLLLEQLSKRRITVKQTEIREATKEELELSDTTQSFLPKFYQRDPEHMTRNRRFVGAVAAVAAGAGLVLGDPVKDAACTALSYFSLCDCNSALARDVEYILAHQKATSETLQLVQSRNDENFFLLGNEENTGKRSRNSRCGKQAS